MLYKMSRDSVSVLQGLIPEVIPSQKCHMNRGPNLNGYLVKVIYNSMTLYYVAPVSLPPPKFVCLSCWYDLLWEIKSTSRPVGKPTVA
jgi:hypothetical protein